MEAIEPCLLSLLAALSLCLPVDLESPARPCGAGLEMPQRQGEGLQPLSPTSTGSGIHVASSRGPGAGRPQPAVDALLCRPPGCSSAGRPWLLAARRERANASLAVSERGGDGRRSWAVVKGAASLTLKPR